MYEHFIGRRAIIRARDAGVHYGTVEAVDGRAVVLTDARRIWRWRGAATLSDVALTGPARSGDDWTRISPAVARCAILDACEILLTTRAADERIAEVLPWSA
jgi:hypothetical protein